MAVILRMGQGINGGYDDKKVEQGHHIFLINIID
jgi:hypothetical protein